MDRLIDNLKQRVPIHELHIPETLDSSRLLATLTDIVEVNPHYVKLFLSQLFKDPELDQDEYYELFSEVIMSKPKLPSEEDLIEYRIQDTKVVIRETPRLISGSGTTGLRTWEAALYLSHYLLERQELIKEKTVLELGSGTGLVSLALIKAGTGYEKLIITDGDSSLIESLSYNFALNDITLDEKVVSHALWWGQDKPPSCDVVVAADVTYDSSVIPSLVDCIEQSLEDGAEEALIAATIRNTETIQTFEDVLTERGLAWEVAEKVERPSELSNAQHVWYSPTTPEIRIYSIKLHLK